jgi:AAA domain-containing protein
VMVGAAGIGKTDAVLKPLIRAWQDDGRRVHGIALAWRQTEDFAKAGVRDEDRKPISEFIRLAKAGKLALDGAVVAIDEVALIGTKSALEILRLQQRHGFTIAAFGDDKQTQAIEAGPVVRLFRRALGEDAIPEIAQTIRQQSPRDREIVIHLRNGEAARALRMMRDDKTAIVVPGNYRDAAEYVAALWKERRDANAADPGFTLTVSVPTNRDALEVGAAIRALRVAAGEVGGREVVIAAQGQNADDPYELRLAKGDTVRLFNRVNGTVDGSTTWRGQRLGVNGTVLEVTGFTADGVRLRRADGTEGAGKW